MKNFTAVGLLGLTSVVLGTFGDPDAATDADVSARWLLDDGVGRAPVADFATARVANLESPWTPHLGRPPAGGAAEVPIAPETLTGVVQRYCQVCHNDALLTGNLSLAGFAVEQASSRPETAEKMILKLRAGMMPPPGMPRPAGDTLVALVEELEARMDAAAHAAPNPGGRTFQRLNQAEYAKSIEDLLDLRIDAGDYLPPDTKSANFDNISEAQLLSPTLLDAYMNAANQIGRLAMGNPDARPAERTYTVSGYVSQTERVDGAPYGTRGGVSVVHHFPADGEYQFRIVFEHTTTGEGFFGQIARFEQLEVSINGARVALLDVDQWMHISDPEGISMRTDPVFVRAGPQRVTAAFVKRTEGPVEDLVSPHDWSLADRHTGIGGYGLTLLPHLRDLVIAGPWEASGVSDTPSRRRILSCRPEAPADGERCARDILARLAGKAYRRPLLERDIAPLMAFYRTGAEEGGFETGIRTALQAILASPHFVFRMEEAPAGVQPGQIFRIGDVDLASRLSFFLWGTPPDDELMALAVEGALNRDEVLEAQVRRMLADPRAASLGPRFAAQWLRLQDLDLVHPDQFWFPDYDQQLADAMVRETELFFNHLVEEDESVLDLYDADYTFVNERLADHYDIPGVLGSQFRRVTYPGSERRGLLGHGSILTLTSVANRTSPVLRGKWVMEVLLGTPPPPPPPGIPDLEETEDAVDGRMLTTRERMERHRANPVCNACHQFMDPIGLALDNFDVTGKWRIREHGMPLDTRGTFYDGATVASPADLREALLRRPEPLIRTFTANLMTYALGRRTEYYDQPAIRAIVARAEEEGYRMSSFIAGVVGSDAFRSKRVPETLAESAPQPRRE